MTLLANYTHTHHIFDATCHIADVKGFRHSIAAQLTSTAFNITLSVSDDEVYIGHCRNGE